MGLIKYNNKYYCEHRGECPYKYCPWHHKGVSVDKNEINNVGFICQRIMMMLSIVMLTWIYERLILYG